jgi:hypothetical protein
MLTSRSGMNLNARKRRGPACPKLASGSPAINLRTGGALEQRRCHLFPASRGFLGRAVF